MLKQNKVIKNIKIIKNLYSRPTNKFRGTKSWKNCTWHQISIQFQYNLEYSVKTEQKPKKLKTYGAYVASIYSIYFLDDVN